MDKTSLENMPSETALFAALRRALANQEYNDERFGPDHLAQFFLPANYRLFLKFKKVRENTKKKLDVFMPGLTEYLIARTAIFDELFLEAVKSHLPQIVLLGAGYDSRPYRFAKINTGTRIFELDAPPTQDRKIQCLRTARIDIPQEVQYVPINFQDESLGSVLKKAGYQHQQSTLFLWEGVSYYLDRNVVEETLDFVSRCTARDSSIAFDYIISLSKEDLPQNYGAAEFLEAMKEHNTDETMRFSIKHGEIESFLAERDLRIVQYLDNETIEQKYLKFDHGALIGKMTGIFHFVCASPV